MGFAIYLVRPFIFHLWFTKANDNSLLMLTKSFWTVGLVNLESINLSFTVITDSGLRKLSGLSSLKSLNLDARQITDSGLAALTSKFTLWIFNPSTLILFEFVYAPNLG